MAKIPIRSQRFTLQLKSVQIQCLDQNQVPLEHAYASGFIVQENDNLFLFTCWHVVTGYNRHHIETKKLPVRKFIQVNLQKAEKASPAITTIGGQQTTILPLYDEKGTPLWIQNTEDVPHFVLNSIKLRVPFWHDAIMLPLPHDLLISDLQTIKKEEFFQNIANVGEKVHIIGYPYGYSSFGTEQPTPIVITRFIAATRIKERTSEIYLDGPGAPGMSGGPIFLEYNDELFLYGIYTGLIYPDHVIEKNEKTTALGTMNELMLWWELDRG